MAKRVSLKKGIVFRPFCQEVLLKQYFLDELVGKPCCDGKLWFIRPFLFCFVSLFLVLTYCSAFWLHGVTVATVDWLWIIVSVECTSALRVFNLWEEQSTQAKELEMCHRLRWLQRNRKNIYLFLYLFLCFYILETDLHFEQFPITTVLTRLWEVWKWTFELTKLI